MGKNCRRRIKGRRGRKFQEEMLQERDSLDMNVRDQNMDAEPNVKVEVSHLIISWLLNDNFLFNTERNKGNKW